MTEGRPEEFRYRRRDFIKQMASAGASMPICGAEAGDPAPGRRDVTDPPVRSASGIEFPRIFEGRALETIAFPLGGIGTGSISLGGRGQLRDWEIFNRPDKGNRPAYCFACMWTKGQDGRTDARILEGRIAPPYSRGPSGLDSNNAPGLPRFASARFIGEFPFAAVELRDPAVPVNVRLEAFTPFIPLETEASSLPVAILRYRILNPDTSPVSVSVALNVDNPLGGAGRRNQLRETPGLRGVFMHKPEVGHLDPTWGSFAMAAIPNSGEFSYLPGWRGYGFWVAPMTFWKDFSEDGRLDPALHPEPNTTASICLAQSIPGQGELAFTFILAWHFPNRTPERCGWSAPKGEEKTIIGNHYTQRFRDAWDAAEHAAGRMIELERSTRTFLDTLKNTTLPGAVLDAALSNLSTLRTTTCFQTADGRFHGFEGSADRSGCCSGSCTHVWNYESALAFLFPAHSRSMREAALDFSTEDNGRMDFRYLLPYGKEHFGFAAADGQMGTVMKFYLDWRLSGSEEWLRRWWPKVRKALEFPWVPGGWDADRDGVMEGAQHTTFDIELYGPNPLCTIYYLGALRAGAEMARAVGDDPIEKECRRLFEKSSAWVDANLFNGSFYVQRVQGCPSSGISPGLRVGVGSRDTEDPDFQVGEGCLTDQLVGQYLAHIAGLGHLLDPSHIRRSLQSVFLNNFKRPLAAHPSVGRIYALNDEAGVVVCDYTNRPRRPINLTSSPEIWTGSEYQLAAHMFFEGMHAEALEIVESIRRRHDGERRNPWDEPECGHHYARALAAWSCVLALCGFDYDGCREKITLRPRMPGDLVRGFWSVPSGWGSYEQNTSPATWSLSIFATRGRLACRQIGLKTLRRDPATQVAVSLGATPIKASLRPEGDDLVLWLDGSREIAPQSHLSVHLH